MQAKSKNQLSLPVLAENTLTITTNIKPQIQHFLHAEELQFFNLTLHHPSFYPLQQKTVGRGAQWMSIKPLPMIQLTDQNSVPHGPNSRI
ncbi:hypothetical protein ACTXT7_007223 [Hymenolepis weldensis]